MLNPISDRLTESKRFRQAQALDELAAIPAPVPGGLAAVVVTGWQIRLRDTIGADDELRARVLAMCLSVAGQMVPGTDGAEAGDTDPDGNIVSPSGWVFITDAADDDPAEPAGRVAALIGQRCGAPGTALHWWVPELDDSQEE